MYGKDHHVSIQFLVSVVENDRLVTKYINQYLPSVLLYCSSLTYHSDIYLKLIRVWVGLLCGDSMSILSKMENNDDKTF